MRIIDFHTHIFPDAIASRAVAGLQQGVRDADLGFDDRAFSDGTYSGLIKSMDRAGVDISVLLPVATRAAQTEGINNGAAELDRGGRVISFGAVYPCEEALACVEGLAERGFKGIKLHGDFQNFHADDESMLPLYRRCGELGLAIVMHAGLDCVSPDDVHVTPERMARVLDRVSGVTFVLAHMGGCRMEFEAARLLSGAENVFFDTSYTAGRLSPEEMRELISSYGADRVLFASDSPWNDPADVIALLESCGLTEKEKQCIFSLNGEKLLGIG